MLLRRRASRGAAPLGIARGLIARPALLRRADLPSAPRQQRSCRRKNAIIESALEELSAKGYAATTVADITTRAGVPIGTFYLHFRSKEQLLLFLMDEFLSRVDALTFPVDPQNIRASLGEAIRRAFTSERAYARVYQAWREAATSDAKLARKQRRIERWSRGRLKGLLDRFKDLPGARSGIETSTLAELFDRLFWMLLRERWAREADLDRLLAAATDLVYRVVFHD